jgi:hypothetical protein
MAKGIKSVTKAVKKVASVALPVIGTAVGGPVGGAIGNFAGSAIAGKDSLLTGKGSEGNIFSTLGNIGTAFAGNALGSSGMLNFGGQGIVPSSGGSQFGGGFDFGNGQSIIPSSGGGSSFGLGSIANSLGLGGAYNGSMLQNILPSLGGSNGIGNSLTSLLGGGQGGGQGFMPNSGGGGLSLQDLLIGGGTLGAGIYAANTAQDAAKQQAASIDQALKAIQQGYDTSRGDLTSAQNDANGLYEKSATYQQPFYDQGTKSLAEIARLQGLDGRQAQQDAYGRFNVSPDYQFRFDQGNRAIQGGAAARGGLYSGRSLKDLTDYGQGQASQEYGNYYNRLNNTANMGQQAGNSLAQVAQARAQNRTGTAANLGNLAQNYFGNQADLLRTRGDAIASGKVGAANNYQQLVGNLAQYATAADPNRLYKMGAQ